MQAAVQKSKGSNSNNNKKDGNNDKKGGSNNDNNNEKKGSNNSNNAGKAAGGESHKAAAAAPAAAAAAVAKKSAAPAPAAADDKSTQRTSGHHADPAASVKTTAATADSAAAAAPHAVAAQGSASETHNNDNKVTQSSHDAADAQATSASTATAAPAAAATVAAATNTTRTASDKAAHDEHVEEQPPHFSTPAPVDWSDSRLPALFGCHNTAAMATSSAIALHTAWELYADDHSGPNGQTSGAAGGGGGSAMHGLAPPPSSAALSFDAVHITTVADVQTFWRVWRYVTPPSACAIPYTYSWFRKDIKPEWEHPRNKKGGTLVLVVFDRDRPGLNDKQALDDAFMATLLGAIGESFAESTTTLNGVMLKLRPNKPVTLHVWTAHSEVGKLKTFANSLRATLSKVLGAKALQKIEYYSHHQNNQTYGGMASLAARMKPKPKTTPDHTF